MLYFRAWKLMEKKEEQQVRKADPQVEIWGRKGGVTPRTGAFVPTPHLRVEENP